MKLQPNTYFLSSILMLVLFLPAISYAQVSAPSPGSLATKYPAVKVEFPAPDGLMITGNLYEVDPEKPVILLCHQAGYNKHEYADIAPKLNQHGYNCLAIDQRSGGSLDGKPNETADRAVQQNITQLRYVDTEPDILAAIDYLHDRYNRKVTLWGSSYSSSLVLFFAKSNASVNAVLAFSPGNYFGQRKPSLATVIPELDVPFFVTSSKKEAAKISEFLQGVQLSDSKVHYIPPVEGQHGSKALWNGQEGAGAYWEAVRAFLDVVYHAN